MVGLHHHDDPDRFPRPPYYAFVLAAGCLKYGYVGTTVMFFAPSNI